MLDRWGFSDSDQVIDVLTSEIVSNAIRHASGPIRLEASLIQEGTVRVEVVDTSPDSPVAATQPHANGGRGILIVQTLARRWGIDRGDSHKAVWFELPVVPRATAPD